MKFSIRVLYCLQSMLELAGKFTSGPVQIRDIAKSQKVPIRYLEQLLLVLKRAGLVVSTRGKEGGYALAKHPSDVSLLEIIETLEGPIELADKKMKKVPVLFEVFEKMQNELRKKMSEITLEDLVFRKSQKEKTYVYNI